MAENNIYKTTIRKQAQIALKYGLTEQDLNYYELKRAKREEKNKILEYEVEEQEIVSIN